MASFLRGRFRASRRDDDARLRALSRGEGARLACRLRRTSSRGWGPWTEGFVGLGPLPDGEARWQTDDPIAVGLPITRGPVDERFTDVTMVQLRPVRFQTEAHYGMDAEIIVVTADHDTTEVALPASLAGPVAERLHQLLLGSALDGR